MLPVAQIAAYILCSVLVALSGCASINEKSPYPQSWPAPSQSALHGCPDISGTYEDAASEVFPKPAAGPGNPDGSLARIIAQVMGASTRDQMHSAAKSVPGKRSVDFAISETGLRVRTSSPDSLHSERIFRRTRAELFETRLHDAFICSISDLGPELRFLAEIDSVAGGAPFVGFGQSKVTVSLFRSFDGSLIVRWNRQTAGIIVLAPYLKNESTWLRFRTLPVSSLEP